MYDKTMKDKTYTDLFLKKFKSDKFDKIFIQILISERRQSCQAPVGREERRDGEGLEEDATHSCCRNYCGSEQEAGSSSKAYCYRNGDISWTGHEHT